MSAFEFVFALFAVIASLALTHLVSGVVQMIRAPSGSRPSLFLAIWLWIAFSTTVGNWGGQWGMRAISDFPVWHVLLGLATLLGQYVFCALVIPASQWATEAEPGPSLQRERSQFVGAFIALLGLAIFANIALGFTRGNLAGVAPAIVLCVTQIALALTALFARWAWARIGASLLIALLSTYWMIVASQIMTSR